MSKLCTTKQLFVPARRWTPGTEVLSTRQARVAPSPRRGPHRNQASHFRRIFIMTQVEPSPMANAIRGLAMDAADIATVLFTQFLKFDAANPDWPDRDRFVLSAGHGSMLLYSLLYLTGNAEMT